MNLPEAEAIEESFEGSDILFSQQKVSLQTIGLAAERFKIKDLYEYLDKLFFFLYLFIFILHSRESELYRYILDGTSALAWELPFFEVSGPPVFHIKVGRPVKCLAQGHNKRTCRLVLYNLP